MTHRVFNAVLTIVCAGVVLAAVSSTSHAASFFWTWSSGCCPSYTSTYYAPVTTYYAPAVSYYAPTVSYYAPTVSYYSSTCCPTYYQPACNPCATACSPCGAGVCPSGSCGVTYRVIQSDACCAPSTSSSRPTPADAQPKTFSDENGQTGDQTEEGDWGPRETQRPQTPPNENSSYENNPTKPPLPPTTIPQREPAPTDMFDDEDDASDSAETDGSTSEGSSGPEVELRIPPLNLDERDVAARPEPRRARLSVQPRTSSPKFVRQRVDRNEGWVPVPTNLRVVKR